MKLNKNNNIINSYKVGIYLGKGTFSKVYMAEKNNKNYALKEVNNEDKFKKCALKEIGFLKKINHKNIVKMEDTFVIDGRIYIIFELLTIDLFSYYFKEKNKITFKNLIFHLNGIINGIEYLHKNNIIHSDIKLENIMIGQNLIKIIDLGSSFEIGHLNKYFYIQSRYYRAPELLYELGFNEKIDVWSYGVVVTELIMIKTIFGGSDFKSVIYKIADYINIPKTSNYHSSKIFKKLFFISKLDNTKCYTNGISILSKLDNTKCYTNGISIYSNIYKYYTNKGFRKNRLREYISYGLKNNYENVKLENEIILIDLIENIFDYDYINRISSEECANKLKKIIL